MQELLHSLAIAKGHLKQCGGVSKDDLEQQKLLEEHQRYKWKNTYVCTYVHAYLCVYKSLLVSYCIVLMHVKQ